MKKSKIIITICMIAVLMMTLCVSTFASGNVLIGDEGTTVDTTEIKGTWVFNDILTTSLKNSYLMTFTSFDKTFTSIEGYENDSLGIFIKYTGNGGIYNVYQNETWLSEEAKTITITTYDSNYKNQILEFLNTNATKTAPLIPGESTVGILDVANEIPTFLTTGLTTVTALFYTDGELTFVGYLAIASLAISVCFLVISIIRNFLHFRG